MTKYYIVRDGDWGRILKEKGVAGAAYAYESAAKVNGHPILVEMTSGRWDQIKELFIALTGDEDEHDSDS